MFTNLSERLTRVLKSLSGRGRLTEDNIKATLRECVLLCLKLTLHCLWLNNLLSTIQTRLLAKKLCTRLKPGQASDQNCHDELIIVDRATKRNIDLNTQPPAVILLAGLQVPGKPPLCKTGTWLQQTQKKTILLTSTDIYRPAAINN